MGKRPGRSYQKRVADINRVYDRYARQGFSNREIWLRFIYPVHGICERTFYNLLKAPMKRDSGDSGDDLPTLFDGICE